MEDFQPLRRQDQTITIWGEVATLGFNVSVNRDYGSLLYERFFVDEDRGELKPAIVDIVRQHLGPQFEARIEIRSGSMWVIVIIQAVSGSTNPLQNTKSSRKVFPSYRLT